jgi:putative ABC transport system substrate-binding protein
MWRREFILGLGGMALVPSAVARGQQAAMPLVGYLSNGTPAGFSQLVAAFRRGLNEAGYVEGRNVRIEFRWAEGREDKLPALSAELIRLQPSVIAATGGSSPAVAARMATRTIPIVFTGGQDPVALGLVESIARPGGNATGVLNIAVALTAKRIELLRTLVPSAVRIAALVNATGASADELSRDLEAAARSLGQTIEIIAIQNENELDAAFAAMVAGGVGALHVTSNPLFTSRAERIVALAARHAMPASYAFPNFVNLGGLMSYGADLPDQHRQAGVYVGRILAGARPADLPVLAPTRFNLLINLKTAKALGLEIPARILALADEVIE